MTSWRGAVQSSRLAALNAICPYFTMFPLEFPLGVLRRAIPNQVVLDPFCGRGTTNFAARLMGLPTIAIDSNPVAIATTAAKLVAPSPEAVTEEAKSILGGPTPSEVPEGEFWQMAFRPDTLERLCMLREGLLSDCASEARKALQGILLGALHGPLRKDGGSSYFSNQSPRTYAPKPGYAVSFWRERQLLPPRVDVLSIVQARSVRFYSDGVPVTDARIQHGDSRQPDTILQTCGELKVDWVITSPPYYGLRTYGPDQWLRNWFLGGPAEVDYRPGGQICHTGTARFVEDLRQVWRNVAEISTRQARLIVRFGAINDRLLDPVAIIKASLRGTPWRVLTRTCAGDALQGKRQAESFRVTSRAILEFDIWAAKAA